MKEKLLTIFKSKSVHAFFSCAIFLILAVNLFLGITYIFRNANTDREHMTGLREASDFEVAYVGGSAAFVYWEVPLAWKEYGITSYVLGNNKLQAETMKGEIKEILKYYNPKLIVIDARPFQYWEDGVIIEDGVRNVTDSMDYSLNRFMTVADCFKYKQSEYEIDYASYFFDIAKYHTNYKNLIDANVWHLYKNKKESKYNGWEFYTKQEILMFPQDAAVKESKPLEDGSERILRDLLEYCSERDLQVIFTVCPYYINKQDQMQFNYMQMIVEEYGYDFINTNDFYEEMDLDFEKDFYNINHVNLFGAEKYTRFLAEYLKSNYSLEDHRGEEGFAEWDALYEKFADEEIMTKSNIENLMTRRLESYENGKKLKEITNSYEWMANLKDENYYILLESSGENWTDSNAGKELLKGFNIQPIACSGVIRVYDGSEKEFECDNMLPENQKGEIAGHSDYKPKYEINSGSSSTITIDNTEYSKKADGLNIVVYDKNYREVLDSVSLIQDESGEILLVR